MTTQSINYSDTVKFVPPIKGGTVIKVYDGDTITIANKLPYEASPLYRFSVRINGIDCPEMRTSNETEKQCAQLAKEFLLNMIMNKYIYLENIDIDKYGRILADVMIDGQNVSELMIKERLAVRYAGGTKKSPEDWMKYHNGC
mgnify:CR=1 FL=1